MGLFYKAILTLLYVYIPGQYMLAQVSADFTVSGREGCGQLQVNFFDQSVSANATIVDWDWDLGGTNSVLQNPGVIFDTPGFYTICLTVTDSNGNTDQECKSELIKIYALPVVDFSIDLDKGCSPLTVNFTNTSTSPNGAVNELIWDLGGSSNVIENNNPDLEVSSTYTKGGLYSVALIVEDERGCMNTKNIVDAIEVFELTSPLISTEIISFCSLPWEIEIVNNQVDPDAQYTWDFGNGQSYNGSQPPSVFYEEGSFDLTIYQEKGGCRDTTLLENFINTTAVSKVAYSPETVCINVPVTFIDSSFVEADSLLWTFEDGTTYNMPSFTHEFSNPGCQEVRVVRYIRDCIDTLVIACIDVKNTSDFVYDLDNQFACQLPARVGLSASSSQAGNFTWEVESVGRLDGPNHTINIGSFGVFNASISFENEDGCVETKADIEIPVVEFEGNLPSKGPSGCTPLSFSLVDSVQSTLPIVAYRWTIGDPVLFTSTDPSPSFEIADIGRYDVQLIVENENGCLDTIFRRDYVQVGERPTVDFLANPLEECLVSERDFFSQVSSNVDFWVWDFGDGGVSNEPNPNYTYTDLGLFSVNLTVFHNGCGASISKEDYIQVAEPVSRFNIEYNCEDPLTVELLNRTLGADSTYWTIELDPTTIDTLLDSLLLPYTFPGMGDYPVNHFAFNSVTGCEHLRLDTVRIRSPRAEYAIDTLRGCAPLLIQLEDLSEDAVQYEYTFPGAAKLKDTITAPSNRYNNPGSFEAPILIVSDIHECKDTFQLADSLYVNSINPYLIYPEVVCVPNEELFIDSSYSTFAQILERNWFFDDSMQVSSDSIARFSIEEGRFHDLRFTATDSWGCSTEVYEANAVEGIVVDPDFTVDTLGCTTSELLFIAGINDPNVSLFEWDFGDGTTSTEKNARHQYNNEGVYTVCLRVEDNRGCNKQICKENWVTIVDPVAEFTGDPTFDTCPPLLSTFSNTSQNANAYIWDFGDQSGLSRIAEPSHVYTGPGLYSVSLIAILSENCRDTLTRTDFIQVLGPAGGFDIQVDTSCVPLDIELNAYSDDIYQYIWDYGNGVIDSVEGFTNVDTAFYTYPMTGVFVPKLIIIDDGGCTRTFSSAPIRVDAVDLDFDIIDDPICGPPLEVSIENKSTTSSNAIYNWLIEGEETIRSSFEDLSIVVSEAGRYDATLFVEAGYCFDTLSRSDVFEIANNPLIDFEVDVDQYCTDIGMQFFNQSSLDYGVITSWEWDFGDGNRSTEFEPNPTFSIDGPREISLTARTDFGCEATLTKTIEVFPSVQVDLGNDLLICIGDEVQLSAELSDPEAINRIEWTGEGNLSCSDCLEPTAQPSASGFFYFEAEHNNGCIDRDSVWVTVIPTPGPTLSLNPDTNICLGTNATIQVLDFNTNYTYNWQNDPGLDCYEDCDEILANPSQATVYYLTVTNEFGCVNNDSILIDVETSYPDFLLDQKTICEGDSTVLEVTGGLNPVWDFKMDLSCVNCPSTRVTPDRPQYYSVQVNSPLGCAYKDSIFVDIVPEGSIGIQADTLICKGERIQLMGSGIGQPSWSPDHLFDNSSEWDPFISLSDSRQIVLNLQEGECIQEDSIKINVIEKAQIEGIGDTICPFEMASLRAFGWPLDAIRWEREGNSFYNGGVLSVELEESTLFQAIGSYRTCEEDTAQVQVVVYPKIEVELDRNYTIYSNKAAQVNLEADRNYIYEWFPSVGLSCDDCPEPEINNVFEKTDYDLRVLDPNTGCYLDEYITVRYTNQCAQDVWGIPNIFSPNQDGSNDDFRVFTSDKEAFIALHVFDRWGDLLFESKDLEESWDGRYQDLPVNSGVYPVRLTALCVETQETYYIFGDVTIVR